MNNKEFGKSLEERTLNFAFRGIRLSSALPNTPEGRVIRNQFTKAGTSVGANYREVNRAQSRADFIHKIKICESETSETIFWLKIIEKQRWADKEEIGPLLEEAGELLGIFTSSGKKLQTPNSTHSKL